jgi:hypothetical protein
MVVAMRIIQLLATASAGHHTQYAITLVHSLDQLRHGTNDVRRERHRARSVSW